ncbi:ArsR/SmtB family transcription factor [Demetria terragena]|uniref:ArsR/SmtB family transcription factor n=1 Tax=Demetria terragena TaxID=63959 RepID=UPI00037B817D|nr:metalloregulator ArsR/SmtB family transcription factor [Demetria terragena]
MDSTVDRYGTVSELFAALASPVRAAAVHRLTEHGRTVTELADELGVSQPLMSQHLRVLRSARVVAATRTGRTTTYTLLDDHVAHVFLDAYRHTEESHDEHHD